MIKPFHQYTSHLTEPGNMCRVNWLFCKLIEKRKSWKIRIGWIPIHTIFIPASVHQHFTILDPFQSSERFDTPGCTPFTKIPE